MASKKAGALNVQQERFCLEYLKDLNGTRAAIRAGYAEAGARVQACNLLKMEKVQERVQQLADERAERTKIEADTVLLELLKLATSDLRKLFDEKGALLPVDQWPDDAARAISSVEVDEIWEGYGPERQVIGHTKKVKFWDKTRGLEMLGKHLKLFTEKHELTGKDGGPLAVSNLTDEQIEARIQAIIGTTEGEGTK